MRENNWRGKDKDKAMTSFSDLERVNAELVQLSKMLALKTEELREREDELNQREARIAENENKLMENKKVIEKQLIIVESTSKDLVLRERLLGSRVDKANRKAALEYKKKLQEAIQENKLETEAGHAAALSKSKKSIRSLKLNVQTLKKENNQIKTKQILCERENKRLQLSLDEAAVRSKTLESEIENLKSKLTVAAWRHNKSQKDESASHTELELRKQIDVLQQQRDTSANRLPLELIVLVDQLLSLLLDDKVAKLVQSTKGCKMLPGLLKLLNVVTSQNNHDQLLVLRLLKLVYHSIDVQQLGNYESSLLNRLSILLCGRKNQTQSKKAKHGMLSSADLEVRLFASLTTVKCHSHPACSDFSKLLLPLKVLKQDLLEERGKLVFLSLRGTKVLLNLLRFSPQRSHKALTSLVTQILLLFAKQGKHSAKFQAGLVDSLFVEVNSTNRYGIVVKELILLIHRNDNPTSPISTSGGAGSSSTGYVGTDSCLVEVAGLLSLLLQQCSDTPEKADATRWVFANNSLQNDIKESIRCLGMYNYKSTASISNICLPLSDELQFYLLNSQAILQSLVEEDED